MQNYLPINIHVTFYAIENTHFATARYTLYVYPQRIANSKKEKFSKRTHPQVASYIIIIWFIARVCLCVL